MILEIINNGWVNVSKDKDGNICLDGDEYRIYFQNQWLDRRWFNQFLIDCLKIIDKKDLNKIKKELQ